MKPRSGYLRRSRWGIPRSKPPAKRNARRADKRRAAYQRFLSSAVWRAQKARVHQRDGHRCVRKEEGRRCQYTKADGPLIANHRRYSPKGIEHTPDQDIETLCPSHNAQYESSKLVRRRLT